MKHLLNFINESEDINSFKDKLVKFIKQNDFSIEDLKRAYHVLQKLDQEKFDELKKQYEGNAEGLRQLCDILEKTGQKKEFLEALLNKDDFPTFDDLLNNNNLFNIMKSDKFGISNIFDDKNQLDDFLKKLIENSYKIAGKGVGSGELFLTTLFKNTKHPNQGDVNIDGHEIEVKFSTDFSKNGGRLTPAKGTLKTVDEISDYFEKLLNDKGIKDLDNITRNNNHKIMIAGAEYINNIFKSLENKLDKKEIFSLLAKMYFYQFNNLSDKEKEFENFISKINDLTFETLIKIHGALALISYHEADHWEWLLVGVSKTSDYYMIDGNRCTLDKFSKNLKDLIEDKHYVLKKYPSNTNGAHPMQDRVAQIYVSKSK